MKIYIRCYPLWHRNEAVSPNGSLKQNFLNLTFKWRCVIVNSTVDGRWLYELDVASAEDRDMIINGLSAFMPEQLTVSEAAVFANELDNKPTIDPETREIIEFAAKGEDLVLQVKK